MKKPLTVFYLLLVALLMPKVLAADVYPDSPSGCGAKAETILCGASNSFVARSDKLAQSVAAPGIPDHRPLLIRDTKLDLGRRLGIDISEITLKSIEPVTWRNSALGCPRPGQVYAQAIVPGYRIVLTAARRDYVYHTDSRKLFKACPELDQPIPR